LLRHCQWQVYLTTPLLWTLTWMLMTPATPSQVFWWASGEYISIHIQQTYQILSITLLVIRVLHLMMQASSIAHMFPSRWFAPLERTPSSLRLALRPVMEWFTTHSQTRVLLQVLLLTTEFLLVRTATTEEFLLRTSCDLISQSFLGGPFRTPFFI